MDNEVNANEQCECKKPIYVIKHVTKKQPGSVMFEIMKNIIMQENALLLQKIAKKHRMDADYLIETYLKPEYYVPIVDKS